MGLKLIGKGLLCGVSGIFIDPFKGAKHHGSRGLLKGIGTGVLGWVSTGCYESTRINTHYFYRVVLKPGAGILGGVSVASQGFATERQGFCHSCLL